MLIRYEGVLSPIGINNYYCTRKNKQWITKAHQTNHQNPYDLQYVSYAVLSKNHLET